MADEQHERRVYSLFNDGDSEWMDTEDLVPEAPVIPDTLNLFYPTGKTVEDVNEPRIYAFSHRGAPEFGQGDECVEATPQEMDQWRAIWAEVEQAQQAFRDRMGKAREAYEAAAREALTDLAEATKPWVPIDATLKARMVELAAKLHDHRTAAKEWMAKKEEENQNHLDAIDGPRVIVLYKPNSLNSHRQADHIAKVHLLTCKRRAKMAAPYGRTHHDDEGLRAGDAWHRLTHVGEWTRNMWGDSSRNMRVKFCSFCKPWTVFQEHLDDFPKPRRLGTGGYVLGEVRLTDLPETWTNKEAAS